MNTLQLPEGFRSKGRFGPGAFNATLYRYFDDPQHADDFCRGSVWTSTLQHCRTTEDAARRDEDEAVHRYEGGFAHGSEGDPEFDEVARRSGINVEGAVDWTIADNLNAHSLRDAFLLCMTMRKDHAAMASFGQYCVEIRNPVQLWFRLARAIDISTPLYMFAAGLVEYKSRSYSGLDPEPGHLGYVKPISYCSECEVRFLFHPDAETEMSPRIHACMDLSAFCRRIR